MITITPIKMTGIFAPLADEFLKLKRAQGYKYHCEEKVLGRFCRFTEEYALERPMLTKELVADWISPREDEAPKTRMHRISCIKQFGKYLGELGYEVTPILPQSRRCNDGFTPYIFTHDEVSRLFRASDSVRPVAQSRHMHKLLPLLIRLLYACGLRISEAIGLLCSDVNLKNGILTIREAKNGRDRLIPVSQSLLAMLCEYRKDVISWARDDDYFFMAPDRTILSPNTVYGRFRRILWDAGVPYGGKGNGPRLHDIRHPYVKPTTKKLSLPARDRTLDFTGFFRFFFALSLKEVAQLLPPVGENTSKAAGACPAIKTNFHSRPPVRQQHQKCL